MARLIKTWIKVRVRVSVRVTVRVTVRVCHHCPYGTFEVVKDTGKLVELPGDKPCGILWAIL